MRSLSMPSSCCCSSMVEAARCVCLASSSCMSAHGRAEEGAAWVSPGAPGCVPQVLLVMWMVAHHNAPRASPTLHGHQHQTVCTCRRATSMVSPSARAPSASRSRRAAAPAALRRSSSACAAACAAAACCPADALMAASSLVCSFCRLLTRSVRRDTSACSGATAAVRAASAACRPSVLAYK